MAKEIDKNYRDESSEFDTLTRMLISNQDFSQAFSAATFLLEEVNEEKKYELADLRKFRCYETSLIISYARPFSQSRGQVKKLRFEDIETSLSKNEIRIHEKIIWLRNKLYGHSDAEFVDFQSLMIDVSLDSDLDQKNILLSLFQESMRLSLSEISEIRDLIVKLIQNITRISQKLSLKYRGRFLNISD